jgi:spore maturation protein CgeB
VLAIDNAYDPATHRPVELTEADRARYGTDVGFVGGYEQERAAQLLRLAREGFRVKLWGYAWERLRERPAGLDVTNRWLDDAEYPKSVAATKINLGFLRKVNRDLQTTRSVEIPAAGGFLLAERTAEHERLFAEGREAEFFATTDELVAKCRYYLEHDDERLRIAGAGRRRCIEGGYSNAGQLSRVLPRVRQLLSLSR